jgi:hypothetical protein
MSVHRTLHLRKALQGLAASGHPFRVSLSATPQAGSPSAAANASRWPNKKYINAIECDR